MPRIKVIIISQTFPWPPHDGNILPIYHYLRCLSPHIDYTLVTHEHDEPGVNTEGAEIFRNWGIELITVKRGGARAPIQALDCIRNGIPWVNRFFSRNLRRRVDALLEGMTVRAPGSGVHQRPVIHAEGIMSGQHLTGWGPLTSARGILVARDCLSLNHRRRWESERHPVELLQSLKIRVMERSIYGKFLHTLAISESDAAEMKIICPDTQVGILPNGVDVSAFKPMHSSSRSRIIAFAGSMEYAANIDAAVYFAKHIWPDIHRKIPGSEFMIVGQKPPAMVLELGRLPGVRVTGFVPSMAETMSTAAIIISPLRWGTGVKNKVLEGAALGKPMVVSPRSLEGIDLAPGTDIEVAESKGDYAAKIMGLLNDEPRRKLMGERARKVVAENHTWEKYSAILHDLYCRIADRNPGGS